MAEIKQFIILKNNEDNEALGEAFELVGDNDFELFCDIKWTDKSWMKEIKESTKWIVLEETDWIGPMYGYFMNGVFIEHLERKVFLNVIQIID